MPSDSGNEGDKRTRRENHCLDTGKESNLFTTMTVETSPGSY